MRNDAFGMSPSFREGLAALGMRFSQEAPVRSIRGSGVPANPGWWAGSGAPWSSAVMNCRRRPGGRSRWPREARVPAATGALSGCRRRKLGPSTAGIWTAASPASSGGYPLGDPDQKRSSRRPGRYGAPRIRYGAGSGRLASPRGPVPAGRSWSLQQARGPKCTG